MKTESASLIEALRKQALGERGSALVQAMIYFSVLASLAYILSEQQIWTRRRTQHMVVKDKYEGIKTNVQESAGSASVVLDSEQVYDEN